MWSRRGGGDAGSDTVSQLNAARRTPSFVSWWTRPQAAGGTFVHNKTPGGDGGKRRARGDHCLCIFTETLDVLWHKRVGRGVCLSLGFGLSWCVCVNERLSRHPRTNARVKESL